MNIGLIFPNKDRRYKTIHLGLASLAAYARQEHPDVRVRVLDTRVATSRETRSFFNTSFDLFGMTVFSPVYDEVKKLIHRIRKQQPGSKICLGGPYVTTIMDEIFRETPADFAVYGEGEITFSELIAHLKGGPGPEEIPGLMYIDPQGKLRTNKARQQIRNLDTLPRPAYDLFPMARYPLHRMVTSRGCPYKCAWCNSSSIWHYSHRMTSATKMVEEIEYLVRTYGKKIFVFGDNSFNADPGRVDEFCNLLLEKKLDILWSASLRADTITEALANKMRRAGCYNAAIGVESANNEILKQIGKSATIEKIDAGIKILKNAGIETMAQYVIGNPGETLETFYETVEYAKRSGSDFTNFYTVLPFKRTPQWDYVEQHGTFFSKTIHDYHTMDPRIVFETPEFPYEDRVRAIKAAKKEGFLSNKDTKNWWFDVAKDISRKVLLLFPAPLGEKLYFAMKAVYRLKIVRKNNV